MTTEEVANIVGCKPITARIWALHNGVKFVGGGNAKIYIWSESDLERFKDRNTKRGRPKPEV